ncbi:EAL domain-containing protein [Roseibium sp. RKSG952]|uniref:EAL domain-containing response regulator n=1 Tax=Roseibium sp. RKSG952 TaxID=2529384 RepID=UPI0012BC967A|nr:EAL domain-containing response regulator [Roseibium sp. RKSG952]MTH99761.1 EAL domain-containing protein [Roseibium sp. RKSG952]
MEDLKVLIVDDDVFMVKLITRMLETLGIRSVLSARDGNEGLKAVAAHAPDLVLCDLNMPGMDGLECVRHLAEQNSQCAVIMISGEEKRVLQTAAQLAEAHQLNVLGAVQKPVTPAALKTLLEKHSRQRKAARRAAIPLLPLETVRQGLANGCLDVFFQPKVAVPGRELTGVEALVRWRDPEKGIMPPSAFLPVIEDNGLIDELTERVFELAMQHAADWARKGLDIKTSVNFSVDTLERYDIVDFIRETLRRFGMDPKKLVVEVTENRIMQNVTKPLEVLTRLRLMGVGLSIDDFGTGASSMQQLKRIPFSELKIDRAFVSGAPEDEETYAMLESSVALARKLGLEIVAEGVETQAEWDLMKVLGIDMVQGYFIAKPMPADELLLWARENSVAVS